MLSSEGAERAVAAKGDERARYVDLHIEIDVCDVFLVEEAERFFRFYQGPRGTFVDIGAHVGLVSLFAATELGFQRVVAIEAWTRNLEMLEANVERNGLGGIITPVLGAVVREGDGSRAIYKAGASEGQYSLHFNPRVFPQVGTVDSIPFCGVIEEVGLVDFLKVDIEGGEFEILAPSDEVRRALRHVRWLDLEMHGPNRDYFDDEQMRGFGYREDDYQAELRAFLVDCGFSDEPPASRKEYPGGVLSSSNHRFAAV